MRFTVQYEIEFSSYKDEVPVIAVADDFRNYLIDHVDYAVKNFGGSKEPIRVDLVDVRRKLVYVKEAAILEPENRKSAP